MKKVVFMGAKNIGYMCFKELLDKHLKQKCEIVGVLTRQTVLDGEQTILNLCKHHNINLLDSLEDYLSLDEVHITISVQHDQILKKEHIQKASDIALNLHLAPLPEYRGCNQFSFAILDKAKWFGATLHEINEGIDSGDIIFERRFRIDQKPLWVKELYDKTVTESIQLFNNNLQNILDLNFKKIPQEKLITERGMSIHYRKDINTIKKLSLDWSKEKIERYIRATYMPNFEPPYAEVEGVKIYFNIKK